MKSINKKNLVKFLLCTSIISTTIFLSKTHAVNHVPPNLRDAIMLREQYQNYPDLEQPLLDLIPFMLADVPAEEIEELVNLAGGVREASQDRIGRAVLLELVKSLRPVTRFGDRQVEILKQIIRSLGGVVRAAQTEEGRNVLYMLVVHPRCTTEDKLGLCKIVVNTLGGDEEALRSMQGIKFLSCIHMNSPSEDKEMGAQIYGAKLRMLGGFKNAIRTYEGCQTLSDLARFSDRDRKKILPKLYSVIDSFGGIEEVVKIDHGRDILILVAETLSNNVEDPNLDRQKEILELIIQELGGPEKAVLDIRHGRRALRKLCDVYSDIDEIIKILIILKDTDDIYDFVKAVINDIRRDRAGDLTTAQVALLEQIYQ